MADAPKVDEAVKAEDPNFVRFRELGWCKASDVTDKEAMYKALSDVGFYGK